MSPTDEQTASSSVQAPISPSSENSLNVILGVPMPTPGMPGAPKFKGMCVSDFLDLLEQHANSMQVPHTQLPCYVLRYYHSKVQMVIGASAFCQEMTGL